MAIFGFLHVVRGHQNGDAVAGEAMDQIPEPPPRSRLDAGGRFIQKQDGRPVQYGAAQRQALQPSSRKRSDHRLLAAGKAGHVDGEAHAFLKLGARHAVNAAEELQVFLHREITVEREFLRHVSDVLADALGIARDVDPGDDGAAAARSKQAAQGADDRRFPRAVGAEKAHDLAARRSGS